jgi:hypothetical protein
LQGEGTRDMSGPSGKTTEQFVEIVKDRFERYYSGPCEPTINSPKNNYPAVGGLLCVVFEARACVCVRARLPSTGAVSAETG